MAEYIEREAIGKGYMDLCLAKSKLTKSRKGATFFQSDLLPETEPTTKELFRLVMAMPAADVVEVRHARWIKHEGYDECEACHAKAIYGSNYCPSCGALMDKEADHDKDLL